MTSRTGAGILVLFFAASGGIAAQYPGWLIPPGGRDEKSPIAPSAIADAVKRGMAVYTFRTALNTDGVLFYKVWNGHSIQLRAEVIDMPSFAGKLSKDEVWEVVEYVKVLRTPWGRGVGPLIARSPRAEHSCAIH